MGHPAVAGQEETWTEQRPGQSRGDTALDVALEDDSGMKWTGTMAGLGPTGAKVRVGGKEAPPSEGTLVRLRFAPSDGGSPMSIRGIAWRQDPDGLVIAFLSPTPDEFLRLKTFATRLPRRRA